MLCVCVCLSVRSPLQLLYQSVFTKFGMDIMTLEATPASYFLFHTFGNNSVADARTCGVKSGGSDTYYGLEMMYGSIY
jgi:hypothetical protein